MKKKQFSAVKLCYNWDAAECKIVEIYKRFGRVELGFLSCDAYKTRCQTGPWNPLQIHWDASLFTGWTFRWWCQWNSQMITCPPWLNSNLGGGGLKGIVYLRVTPGECINEQTRSISVRHSNCLFVTINIELWLKTPNIDIEFLVTPRMKNGTQSEGLVCLLNGWP